MENLLIKVEERPSDNYYWGKIYQILEWVDHVEPLDSVLRWEVDYDSAPLQKETRCLFHVIFDNVMQKIESVEGGLFFLDAWRGTVNNFPWNLFLPKSGRKRIWYGSSLFWDILNSGE